MGVKTLLKRRSRRHKVDIQFFRCTWGARSISFDAIAHLYDETRQLPSDQMEPIIETLRGELSAYNRVLEVGVGTGRIAIPLQERGLHVLGVDISPGMLAQGSDRGLNDSFLADALRLPLRNRSIDAAYSVHLLQFIQNWKRALKEIARVTREAYYAIAIHPEGASPSSPYWKSIRAGMQKAFTLVGNRKGALRGTAAAARNAYYEIANFWGESRSPPGLYWRYIEKAGYLQDVLGIEEQWLPGEIQPTKTVPIGTFVVNSQTADITEALQQRTWSPQWGIPEQVHLEAMEAVAQASFEETTSTKSRIELLKWDVSDLSELALEPESWIARGGIETSRDEET